MAVTSARNSAAEGDLTNRSRKTWPHRSNGQPVPPGYSHGLVTRWWNRVSDAVILIFMTGITQILSQIEDGDPSAAE